MSNVIKILPETLANQIAAGEVIQRPASVVKELIENSVDAQATNITINIKNGGKTLIQVIDDGIGMSSDDARLAFERHATSKISNVDDLFNITTKGFRGEALASIASVAQVELLTKQKDDELGTLVDIQANKIIKIDKTQCSVGTNISVKNLFFNVPARRKFLKSDHTEFSHIVEEFYRVAIAHHEISFKLIHNDNIVFNLPSQSLKERIVDIFENNIRKQLVDINSDAGFVKIYGFVGSPDSATKTNNKQFLFVNRRFFKSSYFNKAIINAYDRLIPEATKPSYFIFFEIEPQRIDVNIHPTKTEINFEDASSIFNLLITVIRKSLTQFDFMPSIDFDNAPITNLILKNSQNTKSSSQNNKNFSETVIHSHIDNVLKNKQSTDISLFETTKTENPKNEDTFSLQKSFLVIRNRYILTPVKSGILFIDVKNAYKQIRYEEIFNKINISKEALPCIYPIVLSLLTEEAKEFEKIKPQLQQIGFEFEKLNDRAYNIKSIPGFITDDKVLDLIYNLIHQSLLTDVDVNSIEKHEIVKEIVLSENYDNIQINSNNEAQELVNKLFACQSHQYTFDGKLILKIMTIEEIEKFLS